MLPAFGLAKFATLLRTMRRAGLRATKQRKELIALMLARDEWWSIDGLLRQMQRQRRRQFHQSTLYGVTKALTQVGITEMLVAPTGHFHTLYRLRATTTGRIHYWPTINGKPHCVPLDESTHEALMAYFKRCNLKVEAFYVVARGA